MELEGYETKTINDAFLGQITLRKVGQRTMNAMGENRVDSLWEDKHGGMWLFVEHTASVERLAPVYMRKEVAEMVQMAMDDRHFRNLTWPELATHYAETTGTFLRILSDGYHAEKLVAYNPVTKEWSVDVRGPEYARSSCRQKPHKQEPRKMHLHGASPFHDDELNPRADLDPCNP